MNHNTFKTGIAYLSKMYGKVDSELVSGYWNILKGYSDEEFKGMIESIIKTFIPTSQVPFPLIPHFLKSLGVSGESRSKLAVNAVIKASYDVDAYRTVSFGDPALHETIERFGGWPTVSHWTLEDWRFQEKNFIACYEAALISNNGADKCPGLFELDSANKTLSDEHKKRAIEFERTVNVGWVGFDENLLTDKSTKKTKQIAQEPQKIGELI